MREVIVMNLNNLHFDILGYLLANVTVADLCMAVLACARLLARSPLLVLLNELLDLRCSRGHSHLATLLLDASSSS